MDDIANLQELLDLIARTVTSEEFILQLLVVVLTVAVAWLVSSNLRRRLDAAANAENDGTRRIRRRLAAAFHPIRDLLFPAIGATLMGVAVAISGGFRTLIFGILLFWIGRMSNTKGLDLIRTRASLDDTTRELALKSFQVALVVVFSLLFLQVAGIDLTALVVFGGAIGVGLGFGLQQIASNFISGVIILLDRSLTIGDYVELEDGRAGTIRELGMRSAILETYDGKDIMVPNEKFITTAFVNWTHNNQKQRYPITFEVAYGTDLEKLFQILRETVASHPRVLSGEDIPIEERPDAEISTFAESGIEILVEFWMEGIDDGKNRVGADLLFMIWQALQANNIQIPYPHRVITIEEKKK